MVTRGRLALLKTGLAESRGEASVPSWCVCPTAGASRCSKPCEPSAARAGRLQAPRVSTVSAHMELWWALLTCLSIPAVLTREIVLPPTLELQDSTYQAARSGKAAPNSFDDAAYAGLTTFANLPWVHCLSSSEEVAKYGESSLVSVSELKYRLNHPGRVLCFPRGSWWRC